MFQTAFAFVLNVVLFAAAVFARSAATALFEIYQNYLQQTEKCICDYLLSLNTCFYHTLLQGELVCDLIKFSIKNILVSVFG
jgi:hypothetical protein